MIVRSVAAGRIYLSKIKPDRTKVVLGSSTVVADLQHLTIAMEKEETPLQRGTVYSLVNVLKPLDTSANLLCRGGVVCTGYRRCRRIGIEQSPDKQGPDIHNRERAYRVAGSHDLRLDAGILGETPRAECRNHVHIRETVFAINSGATRAGNRRACLTQ